VGFKRWDLQGISIWLVMRAIYAVLPRPGRLQDLQGQRPCCIQLADAAAFRM
jgi:hypothetical protein